MPGSGLSHLREGPDLCPLCGGPCQIEMERGDYRLGDPMTKHPDHKPEPDEEVRPVKRPHGKRRPAEDRARHLKADR